jgi:hypothetical protein
VADSSVAAIRNEVVLSHHQLRINMRLWGHYGPTLLVVRPL